MITLVLGGARSGKSDYAQALALRSGLPVTYVATGQAHDVEMTDRIRRHRDDRPRDWRTLEEPLALGAAIAAHATAGRCVIVDCLTLWLTNAIFADRPDAPEVGTVEMGPTFSTERAALLDALGRASGETILVSNEVGTGLVPLGALNRFFVDQAGLLHQAVAQRADRVVSMIAGCPLCVKGEV